MYPESKPILFESPRDFESIEIYPCHDLHYGNEMFDAHRWNSLLNEILSQPNRYVCFLGDLMENALPNSRSNPLTQLHSPLEQREFVVEQLKALKGRVICILDGNHEQNRSTRMAGLYPLYDAACIAGCEEVYRSSYAVIDLSVGRHAERHENRPYHYVGFCTHKAKDLKSFHSVDALEGFDFMLYGHDHEPRDHARAKLCYDRRRRLVTFKSCETINCGAFLNYGGYGAHAGYRPQSDKMYKLVLSGRQQRITTVGFYVD